MRLTVNLPSQMLLQAATDKVKAESPEGHFTLLPNHIDTATAIAPGIMSYVDESEDEKFLAVSEGLLVKNGDEVLVSVRAAVQGELGTLHTEVEKLIDTLDDTERKSRTNVARMEASFLRRFLDFQRG